MVEKPGGWASIAPILCLMAAKHWSCWGRKNKGQRDCTGRASIVHQVQSDTVR